MINTSFPPDRPASPTSAASPFVAASGAATIAAVPQTVSPEVKPIAAHPGASQDTPRTCAVPRCKNPVKDGQTCCSGACRKALSRLRQRETQSHDTKTGTGNSFKNFLGEKINAARDKFAQIVSTNKPAAALSAAGEGEGALVSLAGSAPGSVDRGKAFRKLCRAGIGTIDRTAKGIVRHFAKKKGASKSFIENDLIPQCGSNDDRENLAEALDDYLRSINYVPEKPEMVALLIAAANYGSGFAGAVKAIKDIEQSETKGEK